MLVLSCIIALTLLSTANADDSGAKATKAILDILRNSDLYDKNIRPSNGSNPLVLRAQVYLRNIVVDDLNMMMTADMTYRMIWTDERLKFNIFGVKSVTITDATEVWLPDPFFKNSLKTVQLKTIHPEAYLRVHRDGEIIYSTRFLADLKCPMNLRRFPHDVQECPLYIASYGYTTDDLVFEIGAKDIQFSSTSFAISRFEFKDYKEERCNSKTSTGEYSCVMVTLKLEREFKVYLLEWYLPCIFLVVVAWFSELVPADALQPRLVLTIIPLITISVTSFFFSRSLAPVPYYRALDIFTNISLLVVFATLIHVIVSYYRNLKAGEEKEAEKVNYEVDADAEDGASSPKETESTFRKLWRKALGRADFLTRVLLIGFYIFFLFVYFTAYSS